MEIDFLSAFIIGILGSGHCIGMCGGISTMLTTSLSKQHKKPPLVIAYNLGRIGSYCIIGAIAGFTGTMAVHGLGLPIIALKIVSGVFLVLLGLYIGQWLMWLTRIEKAGKFVWRFISPYTKNFIPINNVKKSLCLGALWGWLPCGLIYSTLTWSLASGSALDGALIMFSFGLGTLPALFSVSFGIIHTKALLTNIHFRTIVALSLIIYGFYTLKFAYNVLF